MGVYPQPRLYPHVGALPKSKKMSTMSKIVPNIMVILKKMVHILNIVHILLKFKCAAAAVLNLHSQKITLN